MGTCWPNKVCNCIPSFNCCHYEARKVKRKNKLHSKWMEILHKINPKIKLYKMTIPGTHDSATYSISEGKCCSSAARTQRLSIYEQLNHGVRFLDIRYGGDGSKSIHGVRVMHGPFAGNSLLENIKQIRKFLDENPNEFIIARFKEERSKQLSNKTRVAVSETILDIFEDISVDETDVYNFEEDEDYTKDGWFDLHSLTLDDLVKSSRRILILGQIKMFRFLGEWKSEEGEEKIRMYMRKKGFFLRSDFFVNKWHNKNKAKNLLVSILKNVSKDNRKNMLFNSQFTLTIDHKSCCDFVRMACCLDPVRIDQHVRRLLHTQRLQGFLQNHIDKEWNYCWFDFIDYNMDIVNLLIGRNFNLGLEILEATYTFKSSKTKVIFSFSLIFFRNQ